MIRLVSAAAQAYEISYRFALAGGRRSAAINVRSLYVAGNWNFRLQQLCDSARDPAIRAMTATVSIIGRHTSARLSIPANVNTNEFSLSLDLNSVLTHNVLTVDRIPIIGGIASAKPQSRGCSFF